MPRPPKQTGSSRRFLSRSLIPVFPVSQYYSICAECALASTKCDCADFVAWPSHLYSIFNDLHHFQRSLIPVQCEVVRLQLGVCDILMLVTFCVLPLLICASVLHLASEVSLPAHVQFRCCK